jgi:hypothetical protein
VKKIIKKHFHKISKKTTHRIVRDVCGEDKVCAKQVKEHCKKFFKRVAKHGRIQVDKVELLLEKICEGRDQTCVDIVRNHLDNTPLNFHHAKREAEREYSKSSRHVRKGIKKIVKEACRGKSEKCEKRVREHSKLYFSEGVKGKHHHSSHKKFAKRICKDHSCRAHVHKITKHTFGKIKHFHHKANKIVKAALPQPVSPPPPPAIEVPPPVESEPVESAPVYSAPAPVYAASAPVYAAPAPGN